MTTLMPAVRSQQPGSGNGASSLFHMTIQLNGPSFRSPLDQASERTHQVVKIEGRIALAAKDQAGGGVGLDDALALDHEIAASETVEQI